MKIVLDSAYKIIPILGKLMNSSKNVVIERCYHDLYLNVPIIISL